MKRRIPQNSGNAIGYAVMALALLLVLAVGGLALTRHGAGPALLQGIGMKDAVQQQWQSDFGDFHAVFQTEGNTFQILAVRKEGSRYYSRGTYTLEGNALTLVPNDRLGVPEAKDPSSKFTKLTYGTYTVLLQHDGDNLVWNPAPPDPQRAGVDPRHPLIQYSGARSITWVPKK